MPGSADPQAEVFRFLADPRTHGLDEPVKRVDTAGAVVFLAGTEVYKVKRAVAFPFMDLSTLERRRRACEAEIAVNRDNAPGVYLDALPIVRAGARLRHRRGGRARRMGRPHAPLRRDPDARSRQPAAGRYPTPSSTGWRWRSGASHARAPLRDAARAAQGIETYIEQNDAAFAERPDLFPPAKARRLTQDSRLAFAVARPALLARGAAGFVRRCHGDLHLRNIVLIDGEPTLFDAVEFSDEVASGDVLYDLAFLLMDLEERDLRGAANRLFNRYLAPEPPEALAGSRGAAAVPEPAGGDPGEGRGGGRRPAGGRRTRRSACAGAPLFRLRGRVPGLRPRRASSRSADCPAWARARSRRRLRPVSAGRPGRSGCAATSSARRCSPSRRPPICPPRPIRRR